jgi:hypothetical protein
MFNTIRTAIKTVLDELVGSGQPLVVVYPYHESNISGFPAITFDISDVSSDFLTNAENVRRYSWKIYIYKQINEVVPLSDAVAILDATADAVIDKIEGNLTLNNTVDYCRPVVGPRNFAHSTTGEALVQELTLITTITRVV